MHNNKNRDAIDQRNRLRLAAGLPPVDVEGELNKILAAITAHEFDGWLRSPLRYRVEAKMLVRARRVRNNPNWKPTGMLSGGGYSWHASVRKQMHALFVRFWSKQCS